MDLDSSSTLMYDCEVTDSPSHSTSLRASPLLQGHAPTVPIEASEDHNIKTYGCCKRCFSMLGTVEGHDALSLGPHDGYKHYNKEEMQESVAKGCSLCRILSVYYDPPTYYMFYDQQNGRIVRPGENPFILNTIQGHCQEQLDGHRSIDLKVFTTEDDPAAPYISTRPVAREVGGDLVMNLAKPWFYECSSGHHDCPTYAKSKLPTRVIDVGSVQDPSLKLFSNGIGQCDHYVALSYCWGGPQPLMTLSANIHSLSSGFAETQLPQTLADAVTVTRRLGFRYLWVDALCIIQDCEKDKAIEIEKMGSIYKNSALTIVASCARSASEGFLKIRDELDYCKLPFLLPNGNFGMAYVMRETENYPVAPLDSRGWTLQEWVLSPRKLWRKRATVVL